MCEDKGEKMASTKASPLISSAPGHKAIINNREVDYFSGFGYFGLQSHLDVIQAACQATQRYGINSATGPAGFGNNPVLQNLEQTAADFFAEESVFYFVSGYLGNTILLQGLTPDYDLIFVDSESHYSVKDAITMSGKPSVTFAHRDSDDLAEQLKGHLQHGQRPLVMTDGIFPVTGELAPLDEYNKILANYPNAILCVDDAHAYGVIGLQGRGSLEYWGIEGPRRYSCGTLSKAIGGHGGIITGSAEFIDQLKNRSNLFTGSSTVPIPAAAAAAAGMDRLRNHPEMRQQLWENVAYAKSAFRDLGFNTIPDTPVPIISLSSQDKNLAELQAQLLTQDIAVQYSPAGSYAGVPTNGAIRIAIFFDHSTTQIDRLVETIKSQVSPSPTAVSSINPGNLP